MPRLSLLNYDLSFQRQKVSTETSRAEALHTVVEYENLKTDLDRIVADLTQLQSREVCVELLTTLSKIDDPSYQNLDYIIFQRIKQPVLCLKNKKPHKGYGVSGFLELTELRIKTHRMVDFNMNGALTVLGILLSVAVGYYLKGIKFS